MSPKFESSLIYRISYILYNVVCVVCIVGFYINTDTIIGRTKSRGNLQNKVRTNVVPVQFVNFPRFVRTLVAFKNTFFNSFQLYCPDNCSEIHVHDLSHFWNENNGKSYKWF